MTKAELQAALDTASTTITRLVNEAKAAKRDARDAVDALAKYEGLGLSMWAAPNSPGKPVCITTDDDDPLGLSVNLYVRGTLVGVSVHSKVEGKLVAAAGLVAREDDS